MLWDKTEVRRCMLMEKSFLNDIFHSNHLTTATILAGATNFQINLLLRILHFITKGLTLDCERGNILRLGPDGAVLGNMILVLSNTHNFPNALNSSVACHGTRKLSDLEIERLYGRDRRRHPGHEYIQHLKEFGPQKLVEFSPLLHCFMDYFDLAAPLLCARIVDVLDAINNDGKPMPEYYFWPDVHEGLRELYLRTQFAANQVNSS